MPRLRRSTARLLKVLVVLALAGGATTKHSDYLVPTTFYTPIVIDLDGDNFETDFTDAEHGIIWDFYGRGPGNELRMAWTKAGKNVGFLWIDRNTAGDHSPCYMAADRTGCNSVPQSGKELFGDITPQTAGRRTTAYNPYQPTGFGALRTLDSNHDGVIDAQDPAYAQLHVWIDLNHNGELDPGENHSLLSLDIMSISTAFTDDDTKDQYGNWRWKRGTLTGRYSAIYDVRFTGDD